MKPNPSIINKICSIVLLHIAILLLAVQALLANGTNIKSVVIIGNSNISPILGSINGKQSVIYNETDTYTVTVLSNGGNNGNATKIKPNADNGGYTWSLDNPNAGYISGSGSSISVTWGSINTTATLSCTYRNSNGISNTVSIMVTITSAGGGGGGGGSVPILNPITGNHVVTQNETDIYNVTIQSSGSSAAFSKSVKPYNYDDTYFTWSLSDPKAASSINPIKGTQGTVTITWAPCYTTPVTLTCTYTDYYGTSKPISLNITFNNPLIPGSITTQPQTIYYNTAPAPISCSQPSGGNCSFQYLWMRSTSGASGSFNSVPTTDPGYNQLTYYPSAITASTYYQLQITSNGILVNSNSVLINVLPKLGAGTITPASQTINYNNIPATLNSSIPPGGNGTYNYTWQSSTDGGKTYNNITGAPNLPSYTPPALIATTYFQVVYASGNSPNITSTPVVVNVNPPLTAPVLTSNKQTVNVGDQFTLIQSTLPTGGTGTYTYSYQSSGNGTSGWTQIPNSSTAATSCNVNVNSVNTDLYYMVTASSGGVPINSNTVKISITGSGVSNCNVGTLVTSTEAITSLPPGQYYNTTGITLGPGFSANGATGSYSFTIASATCGAPISLSQSQNYIVTYQPRVAGITSPATVNDRNKVQTTVQYIDGLGRPIQTVQVQASPMGNDMVAPQAYDQFGREATKYLPYALLSSATSDGSFKTDALSTATTPTGAQLAFYTTATPSGVTNISSPQAVTVFEPSPLNRVIEQGAPGDAWQPTGTVVTTPNTTSGHTIKMIYTSNDGTTYWANQYNVSIDANGNRTLLFNNKYGANQLYVTVSRDENWNNLGQSDTRLNSTEEYKDKLGHVVLKRTYNSANNTIQILSTYYVYDDLGNLSYVLPPLSGADGVNGITSAANQTVLNNLCYQYQYDARNRLVQKRLPGKDWEYMVYNSLDQVVMTQDANQRNVSPQQWTFTDYDALGRVVMTGLWTHTAGTTKGTNYLPNVQGFYNRLSSLWETKTTANYGYTYNAIPQASNQGTIGQLLSVNYYDDYTAPGLPLTTYAGPAGYNTNTTGLPTANLVNVLGTSNMLWKVMYYDGLGRNIMTYAQHYLGGVVNVNNYDAIATTYDFTNAPTTVTRKHYKLNGTSTTPLLAAAIYNKYIYDQVGRKLKSWETINGGTPTLLSQMVYNEVGQVWNKKLHSTDSVNFGQTIAYNYNERGWLLGGSAPLFSMQLQYNTGTNKQYNGNIANQSWQTLNQTTNTYSNDTYAYTYDNLNRLTGGTSTDNYNETGITYDLMGNITALNRTRANTLIDQLSYTYANGTNATNQLQSINDASGNAAGLKAGTSNFTYDLNGNLITDPTKGANGIKIAYNLLNLPQYITGSKTITYVYDATGNKLRRVSPVTNHTDYINGIQYDGINTAAKPQTLTFIQTEEGKAVPNGNSYDYQYYLGDNLGNTRVTFSTKTGVASVTQTDDYYPFGFEINRSVLSPKNEYLYNKKELQEELTQYDYGARFYDPLIARWTTPDPLAEFTRRHSLYEYALNNPIRFIDPTGMAAGDTTVNKGTLKEVVVTATPIKKSTASKVGSFLWAAVDFIPFAGSIKQIGVGIYDGNLTEVALGAGGLALDLVTGGEGGEALRVGEVLTEDALKVAAEDEIKEGAEKALEDAGKQFEEHHSDPKFLGGEDNQPLTKMEKGEHKSLHNDLNEHLEGYKNEKGNTMRPKRGNSGEKIRSNFSRSQRLKAMADFYKGGGSKYVDAAKDFFKQHPNLK